MRVSRAFRGAIALVVVAGASFLGVQAASAVSGSITGFTTPVALRFVGGDTAGAALITLTTGAGDELLTYCIELNTETNVGITDDEGTWTAANVPNIDSVRAILQASFPVRTVAQLQTASGIAGLTQQQAIAGTQGAIWHFTDAIDLDRTLGTQNAGSNIGRLYDFLLGVGASPAPEPAPALTITPATATGTVGTLVGPFTLHITPSSAAATVTTDSPGSTFTDAGGNTIVPTADGQAFWVRPATVGANFHISATADVTVPTGRVFLHPTTPANPAAHQKLVLATSDAVTTTATASFGATAVPPPTTTTTTVPAAGVPTTVAPEATTTTVLVEVLPPVPPAPATTIAASGGPGVPTNPILPATGSSSSLPGLLIASATVLAGLAVMAISRRRIPN